MSEMIATRTSIERGKRLLSQALKEGKLSPEGLAWVTVATDPWHDTAITDFKGIPDQRSGKSVVFQVTVEKTIKKPAALPAGNWQVRIHNNPFETLVPCTSGKRIANLVTVDAGAADFGAVDIAYQTDGADFDRVVYDTMYLPADYTRGTVCVAAKGIEVVNTTSPLNKQGLGTFAQMSQPALEPMLSFGQYGISNTWAVSTYPVRPPPKNLSEMLLLPNSLQWEAGEGCYMPVELQLNATGQAMPYPITPMILHEDFSSVTPYTVDNGPVYLGSSSVVTATGGGNSVQTYAPSTCPVWAGQHSKVAMFTGLSDSTTLTIRCRWILERFPSADEASIVVMATPTAYYDPPALELYSRIVRKQAVAVMFKENPAGEWWKEVLGKIGEVGASLLGLVPHPAAQVAAMGLGAGAHALRAPPPPLPVRPALPASVPVILTKPVGNAKRRKKKKAKKSTKI